MIIFDGIVAVFGLFFTLFLPGFLITAIIFPMNTTGKLPRISGIERGALSFVLSIVTLSTTVYFFSQKAGMAVTAPNIFMMITGLVAILTLAALRA